ncbi:MULTISPECIES: CopG family ribbon-helix-helix protein [unclassified Rhizobium]|uniref:CopG family ribbon-helix-helix protein n=1 Tax=unclassified Rhizobium TaxID=2613769 RepID=UPI001ADD4FD6|nr:MULTISPECIES: CopG family ribbon-helix-helix protein [unclassified Rhizobium]MBO9099700.1 CopG family ribbon-helix-helix protein [Rhizobium sp. L58/93]MBO9131768.1 CopG family ribbon-helix-helix protein [Rhizobium sp. B209b/85]MBO9169690.1 CopG family ribbon-helix-helix protein [Rhizobium sp. L245/93]MBO9185648.1 CopG family ribbon-helix-helix protein [Rhizobium sp. E27B/91]QXZ82414.1 CopG family ribbon-helix-helix protein [Rhizobium sp. K1/93]
MADNKLFVDLSDDTKQRLDRLSKATDRSATSITAEALELYLAQQEWQISAVDEAVRRADRGGFVSHEAITSWLGSWGTSGELPAPKPLGRKTAQ